MTLTNNTPVVAKSARLYSGNEKSFAKCVIQKNQLSEIKGGNDGPIDEDMLGG